LINAPVVAVGSCNKFEQNPEGVKKIKHRKTHYAHEQSLALRRLVEASKLVMEAIKERATFLTKTTDWERIEDAVKNAETLLETENASGSEAE